MDLSDNSSDISFNVCYKYNSLNSTFLSNLKGIVVVLRMIKTWADIKQEYSKLYLIPFASVSLPAGSNHMYYLINPPNTEKSEGSPDNIDWDVAQKEIAQAKGFQTGFGAGLSKGNRNFLVIFISYSFLTTVGFFSYGYKGWRYNIWVSFCLPGWHLFVVCIKSLFAWKM